MDLPADSHAFAPTRWTLVLQARGGSPSAKAAMDELCESYYQPVFRFLQREGRGENAARELTQEFFARLLARGGIARVDPERGRFRSFLLGAVKHFLADMRDHDRRLKRGGGQEPESLDAGLPGETAAGLRVADSRAEVPDTFFDREWALNVMDRGLRALALEFAGEKARQFDVLKPWLAGEGQALSQAEAARTLGWTEGAVKVAVHRMRKRFRELIRAEVIQTVPDSADVDAELRYLVEVLAQAQ